MKARFASLSLAAVLIAALPALADNLYDNGPVYNYADGWTVNFGYAVSDSMQVNGTVEGFSFWAVLIPGDILENIEVSIGSSPFEQNLFDGVMNVSRTNCFSSIFGFNLCQETGSFSGPTLNGNYWITLQNGVVNTGDPVYWDENSGIGCTSPGCPSLAQESASGTIPSEAFTVMGPPQRARPARPRLNPAASYFWDRARSA